MVRRSMVECRLREFLGFSGSNGILEEGSIVSKIRRPLFVHVTGDASINIFAISTSQNTYLQKATSHQLCLPYPSLPSTTFSSSPTRLCPSAIVCHAFRVTLRPCHTP